MAFTYREGLGRPLTYQEMDGNLEYIEQLAQHSEAMSDSASQRAAEAAEARDEAVQAADNMDYAATSDQETWVDPAGKTRLTWAGIEKAGTGDPAIAVDAAARAEAAASQVQQDATQIAQDAAQQAAAEVVDAVDGAVDRAESAADAAQAAADSAFVNADVYPDVASGRAAVADGEQFQVVVGDEIVRYRRDSASTQTEVARYPSSSLAKASFGKFFPTTPSQVSLDLVAGELTIGAGRVVTPHKTISPAAPQTVLLPTPYSTYPNLRIELDEDTETYSVVNNEIAPSLSRIIIGFINNRGSSYHKIYGIDEYTVNGLNNEPDGRSGWLMSIQPVQFNTVSGQILLPACRVHFGGKNIIKSSPATIDLAFDNGYFWYDKSSGEVGIYPQTQGLGYDKIILGQFNATKKTATVNGGNCTFNGYYSAEFLQSRAAELTPTETSSFNINTLEDTIEIAPSRLSYNSTSFAIPAQTVDLAAQPGNIAAWKLIIVSKTTGLVRLLPTPGPFDPPIAADEVVVGRMRKSLATRVQVIGIPGYQVDGRDVYSGPADIRQDAPIVINGNVDAGYIQQDIASFEWIATAQYQDVYDLYDALVTAYPDRVTRTTMGTDSLSNPLYRYDIKPPAFNNSAARPATAKMILLSGNHGYEKAAIYCLYQAIKQILDGAMTDERLLTLRDHCHYIVIPVANPYGFDNVTRKNENGVDLERNYPAMWESADSVPESPTYRGPAPLSENLAQYVDAIMASNTDAVAYYSFHNFFEPSLPSGFLWNTTHSAVNQNMGNRLVARQTASWVNRYSWTATSGYFGYSDQSDIGGGSHTQALRAYRIMSSVFEICEKVVAAGETTPFSSLVATIGTESIINWLLLSLDVGAKIRNSAYRFPA